MIAQRPTMHKITHALLNVVPRMSTIFEFINITNSYLTTYHNITLDYLFYAFLYNFIKQSSEILMQGPHS